MKKIVNLKDLLIEQLRDLYDGELQQLNEMESYTESVNSIELQDQLNYLIRKTERQIDRLNDIFLMIGCSPEGEHSSAMEGLIKETRHLIERCSNKEVCDAALVTSLQHIVHYEIAGYGTAVAYSKVLGDDEMAQVLLDSLREEKHTDTDLSNLAEVFVNDHANMPLSEHN